MKRLLLFLVICLVIATAADQAASGGKVRAAAMERAQGLVDAGQDLLVEWGVMHRCRIC